MLQCHVDTAAWARVSRIVMVDAMRAMLDELMGEDRDGDREK